jgi:transcriptional regulator with XRE-family HTH domain
MWAPRSSPPSQGADTVEPAAYGVGVGEEPNALGVFLRARRERVDPSDHGIRDAGRRRVPGLRREELAFLAGVSAPYYARLEQGRDRAPSPAVLDAIAVVLQLDAEAVAHLYRLAEPVAPRRRAPRPVERVSVVVRRLIDAWPLQAAVVIGRYRDVLAANDLAVALNPGFGVGHNLVRDAFLEPASRELYLDWPDVALGAVAGLRASSGADPGDPKLAQLVGELSVASADFATMWARHDVHAKTTGMKRYRHPLVGDLDLDYQTFTVNGTNDQVLHVFSAEPGSAAADGLALLARTLTSDSPVPRV